jgi:hypothetical protein
VETTTLFSMRNSVLRINQWKNANCIVVHRVTKWYVLNCFRNATPGK